MVKTSSCRHGTVRREIGDFIESSFKYSDARQAGHANEEQTFD